MLKKILLIFLVLIGLSFLIKERTGGFLVDRIYFSLPSIEKGIFCTNIEKVDTILDQSFRYLDKGTQFFVFESEDKQHVIKFLRDHHLKPKFWVHLLRFPKFLDHYRKTEISHREEKCRKTTKGCQIAFERMQEKLGLVAMFFSANVQKSITVFDKIGRKHWIELKKTHFIIQKKADYMLEEALLSAKGEREKLFSLVDLFFKGITYRCKKNICNSDPNVFKNFALINDSVVEVDFGDFFDNGKTLRPELFHHEINRYAKSFRKWASKNMPQILPCIDQQLEKELAQYKKEYEEKTI